MGLLLIASSVTLGAVAVHDAEVGDLAAVGDGDFVRLKGTTGVSEASEHGFETPLDVPGAQVMLRSQDPLPSHQVLVIEGTVVLADAVLVVEVLDAGAPIVFE